MEALVSYMRKLPRDVPAGTRWLYSTGETNLVGTLVQQATKSPWPPTWQKSVGPGRHGADRPPGF